MVAMNRSGSRGVEAVDPCSGGVGRCAAGRVCGLCSVIDRLSAWCGSSFAVPVTSRDKGRARRRGRDAAALSGGRRLGGRWCLLSRSSAFNHPINHRERGVTPLVRVPICIAIWHCESLARLATRATRATGAHLIMRVLMQP